MTLEMRESDTLKVVIKSIYACRFFIPIEKVFCSIRKVKEAFFILKARTIDPDGLNFVKKHFNAYISSILFLFFLSPFVSQLQFSIVLFLIHYQFSNSNYNYWVSGSRLKNSRITADVNWLLCLKNVGSCLSTHWFFLFLVFLFFCFIFFYFLLFFFFTQTPVQPNIHQQENRPQLYAWTLLNYVTHTLQETTRYMTV